MSEYIYATDGHEGHWLTGEEIVRCRDCEHYNQNDAGCMYWVMASNKLLHVNAPDGFCAWGERRTNE